MLRQPIPRLDALWFAVLVLARVRIDSLAEAAVLPDRIRDVLAHPWLGRLLPGESAALLAQQALVDPLALLLIVAAIACILIYLLVDEFLSGGARHAAKTALVWAAILLTVYAPAAKLMLLRAENGPASYSHDGGVIQTEAATDFLLQGRNPYVEDYLDTPMAEWGIGEFRTALYHYPYLPWTFLFSAPFQAGFRAATGWFDQRVVYLLVFALALALSPRIVGGRSGGRQRGLLLLMTLGLNPIMGSDLIFGQNDSFVLAWLIFAAYGLRRAEDAGAAGPATRWRWAGAAAFGLACASKPTAWFFAPFFLLYLWRQVAAGRQATGSDNTGGVIRAAWPAAAAAGLLLVPFLIWDFGAIYEDVWRWSSGTSDTAYQIWGWGASNLWLAAGWLQTRFAYWPFWTLELLAGLPLLYGLLRKQWREDTLERAFWGYGLFLLVFFFVSRFLNENYLGFIAACLALGAFAAPATPDAPKSE